MDHCTTRADKSMHVGNSLMSKLATDNFNPCPRKTDTRDCEVTHKSPEEEYFDTAANPVVELYADCLTENL